MTKSLFATYTDRARRVYTAAEDAAVELGYDTLCTEHILIGLVRVEDSIAQKALEHFGLTADVVIERVLYACGVGSVLNPTIPLEHSIAAQRVWLHANRIRLERGDSYTGPEHILLSLMLEESGEDKKTPCSAILDRISIDEDSVRGEVEDLIAEKCDAVRS